MKFFKKFLWGLLVILVVLNLAILVTGHSYLYKGVWNTYLKGRSGASIDEYQIFHNSEVKAGNYQPWAISNHYNQKELSVAQRGAMEELETIAYLVIKDDSILHEQYWDDHHDSSFTNSFSMAKSIVSILIGVAIEEEKIKSVDQPVSDFLEGFDEGLAAKLTIKHLLTMSSGMNFDEGYKSPFAFPAKGYYGTDLMGLVSKYEVTEEPGSIFEYRSGNTQLLGFILEKATGKKISDYASEKLWKPLGAKHSALWSLDKEGGSEKAFCCFNSNARDFARLGQLYLNNGKWNGEQIIPISYVQQSITVADLTDFNGEKNNRYGYQWWMLSYKQHDVFYARGVLGQYVFIIPDERLVVVRLGHKRVIKEGALHPPDVFMYLDAAFKISQRQE